MRKLTTGLAVLSLAILLAGSLIWAEPCERPCEKAKHGQKIEEAQPRMMPMNRMMTRNMMMGGMMPGMKMGRGIVGERGDSIERELRSLGRPGFFARHAQELDLSDKQVADLKTLKWDHRKSVIKKRAEIQVAHLELEELLDQETVNFDRVKAKIIRIGDLEQQMRLARLTSIQKAHQILTADQLEKAKTLKETCCPGTTGSEISSPSMTEETMKEMMK